MYGYIVFAGIVCAIAGIVWFNLYYGIHGDLKNAKEGEVYHFRYLQPSTGDYERHMVKVLKNVILTNEQIQELNARSKYRKSDNSFRRTNHLVTGQSANGQIRNFYAERTTDCKKTLIPKVLNRVGVL